VKHFADWLSSTGPSLYLQTHEAWVLPIIQSLHITGIGIAVGSALMMTLRLLGWVGTDQTLIENHRRFAPWLTGALCLLLASGLLLILAEPVRELITLSFWLKMACVAVMVVVFASFQVSIRKRGSDWEDTLSKRRSVRLAAVLTFVLWGCIIILGRLIAYDHIWGHLSPATKA
jgi:putative copper export protein